MSLGQTDIILRAERWVNDGYCIGFLDGETYFILGAIPKELVKCNVIRTSNKIKEVIVTEVLEKSSDRIQSDCEIFLACGGCSFRHISYSKELEVKKNLLTGEFNHKLPQYANSLDRLDVISGDERGYRNNVQIKIKNKQKGFFKINSNDLVKLPSNGCLNLPAELNEFIKKIHIENERELKLRYTNEIAFYDRLETNFEINSLRIKIAPNGFFQINRFLIEKWLKLISQLIPRENFSILELFSGSGLISLYIASQCKNLVGYEMEKNAVQYATQNSKTNQIQNLSFFAKNLYKEKISLKHLESPIWIVNPPRNGLGNLILEQINESLPELLLYSSCNYITLVQDVKKIAKNYSLIEIHLLDFFPRTPYFETLTLLKRN